MGTITTRKRKDGSAAYTAQIRIMQKGVTVYQESQTFDCKVTAQAWIKKRESDLAEPGRLRKQIRGALLSGDDCALSRVIGPHGSGVFSAALGFGGDGALGFDAFEQRVGRFVVAGLRHPFASECLGQDALGQVVDTAFG